MAPLQNIRHTTELTVKSRDVQSQQPSESSMHCNPALQRFTENCGISSDLRCGGCLHEFQKLDYELDLPAVAFEWVPRELVLAFSNGDAGCRLQNRTCLREAWLGGVSASTCSVQPQASISALSHGSTVVKSLNFSSKDFSGSSSAKGNKTSRTCRPIAGKFASAEARRRLRSLDKPKNRQRPLF